MKTLPELYRKWGVTTARRHVYWKWGSNKSILCGLCGQVESEVEVLVVMILLRNGERAILISTDHIELRLETDSAGIAHL